MIETIATKPAITFSAVIANAAPAAPCGYQWACQELTEVSIQFDAAIKKSIPHSTSRAVDFGENNFDNKGKIIQFLPRERDFYVTIQTKYSADYAVVGNWIHQAIQVINDPALGLMSGIKPGFVEFNIELNKRENINFRVPIQEYNETSTELSEEDLFRIYYINP